VKDRRAGARQPDDEQGGDDLFLFDLGVLLAPLDQAQPVGEIVGGVPLDHQPAEQGELGLALRAG
jgi:hypothetical protein